MSIMEHDDILVELTSIKEMVKSEHKRLNHLEEEIRDIRELTAAMAAMNEKVSHLDESIDELKNDVKIIGRRPGMWWDKLIAAGIAAAVSGIVGAVLAVILKTGG